MASARPREVSPAAWPQVSLQSPAATSVSSTTNYRLFTEPTKPSSSAVSDSTESTAVFAEADGSLHAPLSPPASVKLDGATPWAVAETYWRSSIESNTSASTSASYLMSVPSPSATQSSRGRPHSFAENDEDDATLQQIVTDEGAVLDHRVVASPDFYTPLQANRVSYPCTEQGAAETVLTMHGDFTFSTPALLRHDTNNSWPNSTTPAFTPPLPIVHAHQQQQELTTAAGDDDGPLPVSRGTLVVKKYRQGYLLDWQPSPEHTPLSTAASTPAAMAREKETSAPSKPRSAETLRPHPPAARRPNAAAHSTAPQRCEEAWTAKSLRVPQQQRLTVPPKPPTTKALSSDLPGRQLPPGCGSTAPRPSLPPPPSTGTRPLSPPLLPTPPRLAADRICTEDRDAETTASGLSAGLEATPRSPAKLTITDDCTVDIAVPASVAAALQRKAERRRAADGAVAVEAKRSTSAAAPPKAAPTERALVRAIASVDDVVTSPTQRDAAPAAAEQPLPPPKRSLTPTAARLPAAASPPPPTTQPAEASPLPWVPSDIDSDAAALQLPVLRSMTRMVEVVAATRSSDAEDTVVALCPVSAQPSCETPTRLFLFPERQRDREGRAPPPGGLRSQSPLRPQKATKPRRHEKSRRSSGSLTHDFPVACTAVASFHSSRASSSSAHSRDGSFASSVVGSDHHGRLSRELSPVRPRIGSASAVTDVNGTTVIVHNSVRNGSGRWLVNGASLRSFREGSQDGLKESESPPLTDRNGGSREYAYELACITAATNARLELENEALEVNGVGGKPAKAPRMRDAAMRAFPPLPLAERLKRQKAPPPLLPSASGVPPPGEGKPEVQQPPSSTAARADAARNGNTEAAVPKSGAVRRDRKAATANGDAGTVKSLTLPADKTEVQRSNAQQKGRAAAGAALPRHQGDTQMSPAAPQCEPLTAISVVPPSPNPQQDAIFSLRSRERGGSFGTAQKSSQAKASRQHTTPRRSDKKKQR